MRGDTGCGLSVGQCHAEITKVGALCREDTSGRVGREATGCDGDTLRGSTRVDDLNRHSAIWVLERGELEIRARARCSDADCARAHESRPLRERPEAL